jgi:hypothetical protein
VTFEFPSVLRVKGDASTGESDGKSYLTQMDAERAGRLVVAVKQLRRRR